MSTWLLPENIADVLPSEARKIEDLRRQMLDNFRLYGYELVMPPLFMNWANAESSTTVLANSYWRREWSAMRLM